MERGEDKKVECGHLIGFFFLFTSAHALKYHHLAFIVIDVTTYSYRVTVHLLNLIIRNCNTVDH